MATVRPHPANVGELASVVHDSTEVLALLWGRSYDDMESRVSLSQLRALTIVHRHGQVNLTRLAEELDAILSSASRLCDRLVAAGLLLRAPNEDNRREVLVRLSPAGIRLLEELAQRREQAIVSVLERMTPAARTALVTGLLAFNEAGEAGAGRRRQQANRSSGA